MATKQAPVLPGQSIGTNVSAEVSGSVLVLRIDLAQRQGPSKSGKSQIIATTAGNYKMAGPKGDVVVGLNIYTKE